METKIIIKKTNVYTSQFEELRKTCFPGPINDNIDQYNFNSEFLAFTDTNNTLLALGRITPNPNGAFIVQTKMLGEFRNNIDTADLCKCFVNPDYRSKYLFEVLILTSLVYAYNNGYKYINGAVVKDSLKERFTKLFFDVNYKQTTLYDPYGNQKLITPMRCDLIKSIDEIKSELNYYIDLLNKSGFKLVKDDLFITIN